MTIATPERLSVADLKPGDTFILTRIEPMTEDDSSGFSAGDKVTMTAEDPYLQDPRGAVVLVSTRPDAAQLTEFDWAEGETAFVMLDSLARA